MPLNSTDFNKNFTITPSGHVETIQYVIKDTSPSQEHPNQHQLQPNIYRCHQSLSGLLMPLNSLNFIQILNMAPSGYMQTIHNVIKDTSPSQEHPNHHQLQPKIYKCHQSQRGFLMPSNSSDFNQILNIAPSGHMQPTHGVIKDTSPSQEHPNHHQLKQKLYKCHQSLRGFLMPSNSSDYNQISNIAYSGHMQTIHNVIKDTSPSQEHQ